jgi:hypothetical protein
MRAFVPNQSLRLEPTSALRVLGLPVNSIRYEPNDSAESGEHELMKGTTKNHSGD